MDDCERSERVEETSKSKENPTKSRSETIDRIRRRTRGPPLPRSDEEKEETRGEETIRFSKDEIELLESCHGTLFDIPAMRLNLIEEEKDTDTGIPLWKEVEKRKKSLERLRTQTMALLGEQYRSDTNGEHPRTKRELSAAKTLDSRINRF